MVKRKGLTEPQKQYIMEHYKDMAAQEIADEIDVPKSTVVTYANRQGLRKYERKEFSYAPPKQIVYPEYTPGQVIPVSVRELNRDKVTRRNATVSEVYPCFVLLLIPSQYGDISTRTCIDYYDLTTGRAVVI